MTKEISLVEVTKFKLRKNVTIDVYPASLELLSVVSPKIEKLEKTDAKSSLSNQIDLMVEIVYDLIKEDNPQVKVGDLKSILTAQGASKIMEAAVGTLME